MKLSITERMLLLHILPPQGDIITLRLVRNLQADISLSEKELKEISYKRDGGQVTWNDEKAKKVKPKNIEIGEICLGIIREELTKLNDKKQLTQHHIPLYERFVEGKSK